MRALPVSIGPIHFVGIGGIGMSGIAEVLHNLGYRVQGSDIAENYNVARVRAAGIPVSVGHDAENLGDAQVVVVSTAVGRDNPEVQAARQKLIPVVRRAEMLAELMRLRWGIAVGGTHGKTTTTSLVAAVLEAARLDPTVINGGIVNAYGTNTRLGEGDWMVVEADESDGSFLRLPSCVAVVTNMDAEHLDHWGTVEAMKEAYAQFVSNIPFYGFAVLCLDHPEVQAMIPRLDRRIITYGFSPQADVRAEKLLTDRMGATFEVTVQDRATGRARTMKPFRLPMLGAHNVQNALAAIAVGVEMEIDEGTIRSALAGFKGVKRRFTRVGEAGGITVIDDYGHHPVEIAAVLKATRQAGARDVIAVVQPHRYSPPFLAVRGVLHLHERRRHGYRGRCLRRRRGAGGGHGQGRAGGGPPRARPPLRGAAAGAGEPGGDGPRHRQAGRLRGLPRRRQHHRLGARVAGAARRVAGQLARRAGPSAAARGRKRRMSARADMAEAMPAIRGRLRSGAALAPLTWFRVGGPAEWLARPADAEDLVALLAARPPGKPLTVIGAASNLIIRDGGVPGLVGEAGRRLRRRFGARPMAACWPAPRRSMSRSPSTRPPRGSPDWSSCAASRAASAARWR